MHGVVLVTGERASCRRATAPRRCAPGSAATPVAVAAGDAELRERAVLRRASPGARLHWLTATPCGTPGVPAGKPLQETVEELAVERPRRRGRTRRPGPPAAGADAIGSNATTRRSSNAPTASTATHAMRRRGSLNVARRTSRRRLRPAQEQRAEHEDRQVQRGPPQRRVGLRRHVAAPRRRPRCGGWPASRAARSFAREVLRRAGLVEHAGARPARGCSRSSPRRGRRCRRPRLRAAAAPPARAAAPGPDPLENVGFGQSATPWGVERSGVGGWPLMRLIASNTTCTKFFGKRRVPEQRRGLLPGARDVEQELAEHMTLRRVDLVRRRDQVAVARQRIRVRFRHDVDAAQILGEVGIERRVRERGRHVARERQRVVAARVAAGTRPGGPSRARSRPRRS